MICEHVVSKGTVSNGSISEGSEPGPDAARPVPDGRLRIAATAVGWLLSGEIDSSTAPALCVALADSSGDVVLDLDGVTFMDSSGLQCVIDATRHLRANDGDLTLRRPGPAVRRLIEITGLDTYLRVDL